MPSCVCLVYLIFLRHTPASTGYRGNHLGWFTVPPFRFLSKPVARGFHGFSFTFRKIVIKSKFSPKENVYTGNRSVEMKLSRRVNDEEDDGGGGKLRTPFRTGKKIKINVIAYRISAFIVQSRPPDFLGFSAPNCTFPVNRCQG